MHKIKKAVAIRHVAFEDLGSWETLLSSHGYTIRYVDAGMEDINQLIKQPIDLLFILGGPIGACQKDEYPFLEDEYKLVENRLKNELPTLGICLGAQIMAHVLGAKVYPNFQKEIGWHPLQLTSAGQNSSVRHLDSHFTSMFHWHGDTFDLPKDAILLGSSALCKNQIFSWGAYSLGFQCHPEVCQKNLEKWWIGHAGELDLLKLSARELRKESEKHASLLEQQSHFFLRSWLQNLAL